jgi:hypothetical protein
MVNTVELTGVLYAHHVTYAFHYAYRPVVARTVTADRADIVITDHHAFATILHVIPQAVD